MQSTLSSKLDDDPCDDVVIAPDVVRVAPSDEELSNLLHKAARHRLVTQAPTTPDFTASPTVPPIDAVGRPLSANDMPVSEHRPRPTAAPVDAMFRPAPANDVHGSQDRSPNVRGVARAFITLALAACIGLTAVAWYGEGAAKKVVKLATQLVVTSSQPEKSEIAAQPAASSVPAEAARAASEQPAPSAQTAPDAIASAAPASPDSTELLQSMARDLARLRQEVEELRANMEELKANLQQKPRDVAKEVAKSEQNLRPRALAPLPRSATAQPRKPMQPLPPPQGTIASPALPQVAAPYYVPPQRYVPSQPEPPPQAAAGPPVESDSPVLRPPMPVR